MPWGRYPERVKAFKEWAQGQVNGSNLSGSATPKRMGGPLRGWRRKRRSIRRRRKEE